MTEKTATARMNAFLKRLGLPFKVDWSPDPTKKNHGNIDLAKSIIHIYDVTEPEAWQTLLHEVLEVKFRPVTSLYQNTVNGLITVIEKQVYKEKERFLNELPMILKEFHLERGETVE